MMIIFSLLLYFFRTSHSSFTYPGIEVPHAVIITKGNNFQCQGINWDGSSVLTAGHCVKPNETYNLLSGFTDENGMMKRHLFRTTNNYTFQFPKYNHTTVDHDMALILVKDIIEESFVTAPASPHHCVASNLRQCFLIFWDFTNPSHLAYPVSIKLRAGLCLHTSIFPGITIRGRVFCGEADLCIPDVSGAALNCARETVGMAVRSKCVKSDSKTEILFINLDNAKEEIYWFYTEIMKNRTENSTENERLHGDTTYKSRRFYSNLVESKIIEKKLKHNTASKDHFFVPVFYMCVFYVLSKRIS